MSASRFGHLFQVQTFGESHGPGLGVVIDGCPAGVEFSEEILLKNLNRRKPGGELVSARNESDVPEVLSGVYQGLTLGTPICIIVRNQNQRSTDYEGLKPRIGHADQTWIDKFGHVDPRGGGRSSGRETIARVMAGAVAEMAISKLIPNISVVGYSKQIGPIKLDEIDYKNLKLDTEEIDQFSARFPSIRHLEVHHLLKTAKENGESYGGIAEFVITNLPKGLGQPVFHKLKADLTSAIMSVGATQSVQIGDTNDVSMPGTEFHKLDSDKKQYGGQNGGISNGEDLFLSVNFKPTSSILDIAKKGRHDPCIIPRAIPVVEAMVKLVLIDHLLWTRLDRI